MKFNYLFKVNPSNPSIALECLGFMVTGDKDVFQDSDVNFVAKQDFITAVPIELALTTDFREKVYEYLPKCRFVLTGVRADRVANLAEYGYEAYAILTEQERDTFLNLHSGVKEKKKKEPEVIKPIEPSVPVTKPETKPESKVKTSKLVSDGDRFTINGKEVSKEEFNAELEKIKGSMEEWQLEWQDFWKKHFPWYSPKELN